MKKTDKAVALKYKKGDNAPLVLAKAAGVMLDKMMKLAEANGVTVYKDDDLAESLYALEIGDEIPPQLYAAVSEVIAYCYRVNGRIKEGKIG